VVSFFVCIFEVMKRFFYFVLFSIISLNLKAQAYHSIFGNNSTEWILKYENLFGNTSETFLFTGDTLVNSIIHKKISTSTSYYFFIEDLMSGEVSYFSDSDTSKKTIMNLSLAFGDTFYVEGAWLNNPGYYEVDSVFTYSNKKHIRLNLKLSHANDEKLTFIEGVGTNLGNTYQDNPSSKLNPYLLCSWKDELKEYANIYYQGQCNLITATLDNKDSILSPSIYPNPASSELNIVVDYFDDFSKYEMTNILGEIIEVFEIKSNHTILPISNLNKGCYFIRNILSGELVLFTKI
jgi:hypothetical protein